jgi:histone H3/H4
MARTKASVAAAGGQRGGKRVAKQPRQTGLAPPQGVKKAKQTKKSMQREVREVTRMSKAGTPYVVHVDAETGERLKKDGTPVKPPRFHPGTVARRRVKKLFRSTALHVTASGFSRLVRKVALEMSPNLRFQPRALYDMAVATEATMARILRHAVDVRMACKKETLQPEHIQLAAVQQLDHKPGVAALLFSGLLKNNPLKVVDGVVSVPDV